MAVIEHTNIQTNKITLHVATAGDPANPMLLFLHGFPEFWYAWRHQLEALSDRFFCVAPDTRGINRSEKPVDVDDYVIEELVADTVGLIGAFDKETAIVIGHDWGGFIAWETAIRHPEVVEKLVIVNCAHPAVMSEELHRDGSEQQTRSQYMLAFRAEGAEALLAANDFEAFRSNILEPLVAAGHMTASDAMAYVDAWSVEGALTGGLNYYRANRSGPPSGDDAEPRSVAENRVTVPTMVIWGEADPYFAPDCVTRMDEAVEDLRLERMPGHDHWIVHQATDRVTDLIRDFAGDNGQRNRR